MAGRQSSDQTRRPERRKKQPRSAGQGIAAIVRALDLLELLGAENFGLTLSEIARRLNLNKQIVVRLLQTLVDCGYIYKNSATETFHLSYKISNLGMRTLLQQRILEQSSSVIRDLSNKTGELVRLAVVENDNLVWVLGATGKQKSLHIDPNFVPRISLNTTATGKAWLSTMASDRVRVLMKREGFTGRTERSIKSLPALEAEMKNVRRRGFAISIDESEIGVGAVAVPIMIETLDGKTQCAGTISVSAPTSRFSREAFEKIAPLVLKAAERLAKMWPRFDSEEIRTRHVTSLHWV